MRGYTTTINTLTTQHNGRVVKQDTSRFLMSFDVVTDAITCGVKIQESLHPSL